MLPDRFVKDYYWYRRRFIEEALDKGFDEKRILEVAPLLAPMIASYGPAGLNIAPFMVSFVVKEQYLSEAITSFKRFVKNPGPNPRKSALNLLLETVYNPDKVDLRLLATHLMSRGHTWINVSATSEVAIGILLPPDKGAYEIRAEAWIVEEGPLYEYVNLLHDIIHVTPHGERTHPWYPAMIMKIKEIYDNSYQALGKRIYP